MRLMKPAMAALFVLMGTIAASAHAKMVASKPADGASVAAGVSEIQMQFSHPMRLTLVKVHRAADDASLALKGPLQQTFAEEADVSVEPLSAGAYDVSWTAVSKDGHVMKGHFAFTVKASPDAAAQ